MSEIDECRNTILLAAQFGADPADIARAVGELHPGVMPESDILAGATFSRCVYDRKRAKHGPGFAPSTRDHRWVANELGDVEHRVAWPDGRTFNFFTGDGAWIHEWSLHDDIVGPDGTVSGIDRSSSPHWKNNVDGARGPDWQHNSPRLAPIADLKPEGEDNCRQSVIGVSRGECDLLPRASGRFAEDVLGIWGDP